jgi:phosphonate transport system substrate-binding protein
VKNIIINLTLCLAVFMGSFAGSILANEINIKMVFVPASEKGDDQDYVNLIKIIEKLTGYEIEPIKVTDYNAAVEAMRAGRAMIAWYGGKTYIVAAEIADAEAFAAGVRKGDTNANYFTYFVVTKDSKLNELTDAKGKILAMNHIGSTSGDLIPQVELSKFNLSIKRDFKNVFYAGSHDACLLSVINKHADVCAMSSRNFDARLADGTFKREDIKIIHTSSPVPPPPLAYSKRLPQEVRNKIKAATLEAHKYGKIGGYGGEMEKYIEVKDSDYDLLREVDRLLKSQ